MKFRTEYSNIEGTLKYRMQIYLGSLIGESLTTKDGPYSLKNRAISGASMEFGINADLTFPNQRSAILICGKTIAEIHVI